MESPEIRKAVESLAEIDNSDQHSEGQISQMYTIHELQPVALSPLHNEPQPVAIMNEEGADAALHIQHLLDDEDGNDEEIQG